MWVIFNKFPPFIDIRTCKGVVCKQEGTTLKSLGIVAMVSQQNKTLLNERNEKEWVLYYLSTHLTYHKGMKKECEGESVDHSQKGNLQHKGLIWVYNSC